MVFVFYILFALLLVTLYIWLDFFLGKRKYLHQQNAVFYPSRKGQVQWIDTGKVFFETMFEDIQHAKSHVHVLFYIFRNDSIGSQFIDLLIQKASEGVEINFLVDRVGSGLNRKGRQKLKKAGVTFAYAKTPSFPFFFFTLNRRNHRKITVIDGKIGYTGGFNVGDEYLGRDPKLGLWRDFHLRFYGEGVQDLQSQFLEDWKQATRNPYKKEESYFPPLEKGSHTFHFFATEGHGLDTFFLEGIKKAKNYIYIASPYYVPSIELQSALLDALKRGVEVCIILPEKRDHPLVKEASISYLEDLIKGGASIFHFQQGFFHAKAVLIDDKFCDVGSANFDKRSFFLNSEMNTMLSSPSNMSSVKNRLEKDMSQSTILHLDELQYRPFKTRVREKIAGIVEPLL
ncbi:cardiolipin synthase [Alteribacillus bidgolensis]|uniref:Cardiolipin synthase n=1 Tax=Alteribacillus bidgolensis TaxID=930129 RepID=A0A1G8LZK9_9BACI|nr:cardiolipin synthase [Alteribacillus bidgolensis]SDI61096.1 cardiolipin synthase [Alteribacillus bidgolensis]